MAEENISQEFRLKSIGKTRKHFPQEIEQNEVMSKKHKKVCIEQHHIEHFLF